MPDSGHMERLFVGSLWLLVASILALILTEATTLQPVATAIISIIGVPVVFALIYGLGFITQLLAQTTDVVLND